MIRTVIQIDEEKCNGCGLCANACHEGAIEIIGGKAKLTRDDYCDGFGDCLPSCPTGAITFIEREAAAYDEAAVKANMERKQIMLNAANGNIEGGRATSPAAHAHAPPMRAAVLVRPYARSIAGDRPRRHRPRQRLAPRRRPKKPRCPSPRPPSRPS